MTMEKQLAALEHYPDISEHSFKSLLDYLVADHKVQGHAPDDLCQLDPRDGSMIIYAEHRSLRRDEHQTSQPVASGCPICEGKLTNVVDATKQSEGFTFISQNMYPVLYPKNLNPKDVSPYPLDSDPKHHGRDAYGFHLLQWTSSIHDRDWHNLPFNDVLICMQRLSQLEKKLLLESAGYMPKNSEENSKHGYVSVIKYYGAAAGASLTHGHQQIAFSNIMPQRMFNNARFFDRHQKTFSEYLWQENPDSLTVSEIGTARIVVPYFMRRPFNVLVILDTQSEYLHELSEQRLEDLTRAMQRVVKTFHKLLPDLGRDISYNMALHTGPDNHVYAEFFPMIQTTGGFERIGLWICQLSAEHAAAQLREYWKELD